MKSRFFWIFLDVALAAELSLLTPSYLSAENGVRARAEEYYRSGVVKYVDGEYLAAARVLDSAVIADPTFPNAYNALGLAYLKLNRCAEAERFFRKAIELDANYVLAYQSLGTALFCNSNYAAAIQVWSQALALKPTEAETIVLLINIGKTQVVKGDVDAAVSNLQKAIQKDPGNLDAHFALGQAYEAKANLSGALMEYHKIIDSDSAYLPAYSAIGDAYYVQNEILETIRIYERVIKIDPGYSRVYIRLSKILQVLNTKVHNARDQLFIQGKRLDWKQFQVWPGYKDQKALEADLVATLDFDGKAYKQVLKSCVDSLFTPGFLAHRVKNLQLALLVQGENSRPYYRYAEFMHAVLMAVSQKQQQVASQAKSNFPNIQLSDL